MRRFIDLLRRRARMAGLCAMLFLAASLAFADRYWTIGINPISVATRTLELWDSAGTYKMTITAPTLAADRAMAFPDFGASTALVPSTLTTNAPDVANSIWGVSNGAAFEGATANGFETTLTVTDPTTPDKVVTLPDQTGAVILSPGGVAEAANAISGGTGTFIAEGATANAHETIIAFGDPTVGDATVTVPDSAGVSSDFVLTTLAQTLTNKTITGAINTDYKVLAASATYDASVTPTALTGFSWTVVAGATYDFQIDLDTTMTTNGGLELAFALTTATLTSIRYTTYAATASDNTTAVSSTGTTTASATAMFDSKTSAYTTVRVKGSFVVGTGGTFALTACQETSAAGGDATLVLIGSTARVTRAL